MTVSSRDRPGPSDTSLSTSAAILAQAARLLAEDDASMAEIATAAGVGRATLYRHFPTRDALVAALAGQARAELADRIADAGLERAAVPEAIERLARALLTVGDRYLVLVRERAQPRRRPDPRLDVPLDALFERGARDGVLRGDVRPDIQRRLFTSLVAGALRTGLQREVGIEEAAATLTSLFLDGARPRQRPRRS